MRRCQRGCTTKSGEWIEAEYDSWLCVDCGTRLLQNLGDAADLLAHMRALIDPMKAQTYDSERLSGGKIPFSPAPVNVDLIDAQEELFSILATWARKLGDRTQYASSISASATPEEVFAAADWAASYLLLNKQRLLNLLDVVELTFLVIDYPTDPERWTFAKALAQFPIVAPSRWSKRPCPHCDLRTVRITPPRYPHVPTRYLCTSCQWEPGIERDIWILYFEGV